MQANVRVLQSQSAIATRKGKKMYIHSERQTSSFDV